MTSPSPVEIRVASELRKAVKKKEEREAATVRLYTLCRRRKGYSPIFCAWNDKVALDALKEISRTVKELSHTDLYCVGSFCTLDGKLQRFAHPLLVLENGRSI